MFLVCHRNIGIIRENLEEIMTFLIQNCYPLDIGKHSIHHNIILMYMSNIGELTKTEENSEELEVRLEQNDVFARLGNGLEYPVGSVGDEDDLFNYSPTKCPEPSREFFPDDHHEGIPSENQIPTTVDDVSDQEMEETSGSQGLNSAGVHGSSRQAGSKRLWEFLRDMLLNSTFNPSHIKWTNRTLGEFKIVQTVEMAKMWGEIKNNNGMTYEKMSRAIRYYYKRKIMAPVLNRRLVYKFGPKSYGWQINEESS